MNYDLKLSEIDFITWQLRIIFPELSMDDLERLYYVWKYPIMKDYESKWIENKLTKTFNSAHRIVDRFVERDVIVVKNLNGKKHKVLHEGVRSVIQHKQTVITLNLLCNDQD
jgi:hypothetical protein